MQVPLDYLCCFCESFPWLYDLVFDSLYLWLSFRELPSASAQNADTGSQKDGGVYSLVSLKDSASSFVPQCWPYIEARDLSFHSPCSHLCSLIWLLPCP